MVYSDSLSHRLKLLVPKFACPLEKDVGFSPYISSQTANVKFRLSQADI